MTPILLALAYLACGIVTRAVLIRCGLSAKDDAPGSVFADIVMWWLLAVVTLLAFMLARVNRASIWLATRHPLRAVGAWWHASQTKRALAQFMPRLGRRDGE